MHPKTNQIFELNFSITVSEGRMEQYQDVEISIKFNSSNELRTGRKCKCSTIIYKLFQIL